MEHYSRRRCGILLHLSCLPSLDSCFYFIDFLKKSGQTYWQILPLNPVMKEGSPYKCYSAFAGETKYIGRTREAIDYNAFLQANEYWLPDYSLFTALKKYFNDLPWNEWEREIAHRNKSAIEYYEKLLKNEIEAENLKQFQFFCSWQAIMKYAKKNGVSIIGDMPLYVAHDSADVWSKSHLFNLDSKGNPKKLAGVPPDYFSSEGQLWGNPTYNWENMKEENFQWWKERISHIHKLAHIVRLDHFRGLESYWETEAGEISAKNGKWVKAPGEEMLKAAMGGAKGLKIIAEDLGTITPEVIALKNKFSLPGMKVLQFETDIHEQNLIVYTGTHDNDTLLGWYKKLISDNPHYAENMLSQMNIDISQNENEIIWGIIEYGYKSIADTVIIPMQDILGLGSEARMNIPGVAEGNWKWSCELSYFNNEVSEKLYAMASRYGRTIPILKTGEKSMNINSINSEALELFLQGKNHRSYEVLGSHFCNINKADGILFTLWAPNAQKVSVVGDFNGWNPELNVMERHSYSQFWTLFIPDIPYWSSYKYAVKDSSGKTVLKADPFALHSENRPSTASKAIDLSGYTWSNNELLWQEAKQSPYEKPVNIYEVHLGSWKRGNENRFLTYRELAEDLPKYANDMGYTHIEIMPIMEHPFDGSWGYQITGYFAVTGRYGTPQDFMYFVDKCHENGIGVILDWVPGHFCKDEHGLYKFDGTPLYEYQDEKRSENHGWGTAYFDLGRNEVISFLISNAMYWLDIFHIDGLRTDAVASMLYLDYDKKSGEWAPNKYGGRENIEAINFLRKLNEAVFQKHPYALMIAEESTSWPLVTAPAYTGGLGFNYKWNMGWMNDMLKYMQLDAIDRKWHHNLVTFSMMYAYSENFVLPLSHDEVVHGKKSLIDKMWGDYWQKFASLRLFLGYMIAHPGKKLLFMGGEFAQFCEWRFHEGLEWFLLSYDSHSTLKRYVHNINHLYKETSALWELDHESKGFKWIDPNNYSQSIITFIRQGKEEENFTIVICNFTPVVYEDYNIGVPKLCDYKEIMNSDSAIYGGSNVINQGIIKADELSWHGQPCCIKVRIPPLAISYIKPVHK